MTWRHGARQTAAPATVAALASAARGRNHAAMRTPSRLPPVLLALSIFACGGPASTPEQRAARLADDAEEVAFWPDPDVKSLQLYVVLTPDAQAMAAEDSFGQIDAAVNGEGPRYQSIRKQATIVPSGYRVDFGVDFAQLPHPALDPAQLAGMLEKLPAEAQALAASAKLAVFVRGDARLLPQGNQIRLTGLVPLQIADRWDGVILDLVARRAWTRDQWHAELSAPALSERQMRFVTRDDAGGTKWLLTRGNPKFGLPDLEMRGVAPAALAAARAKLSTAQAGLQSKGPTAAPKEPCAGPKGTYDADCRLVR